MNIIISVVIPLYNTQEFLLECLDSIASQFIKGIEVIVINDGSTDESARIAEEYSETYKFVKVFHQSNQGVFSARNKGLKESKGEYILFLDADDYLAKGSIYHLVSIARKKKFDIVFFGLKLIGKKSFFKTNPYLPNYKTSSNVLKAMFLDNPAIAGYMGGKLIKTSIARQALDTFEYKDDRLELYEDCLFLFCVAIYCRTALTISKKMYVYRIHTSSITQRKILPHIVIEKLETAKVYFKELEELPLISGNEDYLQALIKINKTIDSSILIQNAKKNDYISNIYRAWLLDSRVVNLARIIIYISTFGTVRK